MTGGFVGGGGGRVTIIKAEGAALNWFIGIQGEPGGDSMYFDIDCWRGNSTGVSDPAAECNPAYIMCHNAVIGHDNCVHGSRSSDPTFIYLDHGALHLGNFSGNPDFQSGAGGMLNFTETLQVEGRGYIKELSHGLPSRRLALSEGGVAGRRERDGRRAGPAHAHRGEHPANRAAASWARRADARGERGGGRVLRDHGEDPLARLACLSAHMHANPRIIQVSGVGSGGACGAGPCVYTGRYLATPVSLAGVVGTAQLAFETLASSRDLLSAAVTMDENGESESCRMATEFSLPLRL